jgi:hypothetical protein
VPGREELVERIFAIVSQHGLDLTGNAADSRWTFGCKVVAEPCPIDQVVRDMEEWTTISFPVRSGLQDIELLRIDVKLQGRTVHDEITRRYRRCAYPKPTGLRMKRVTVLRSRVESASKLVESQLGPRLRATQVERVGEFGGCEPKAFGLSFGSELK